MMGCYSGTTAAGCVVDDGWHANDGLVNTLSARAPLGAPQKPFDRSDIERGVWNVMPDLHADHGFFQGGFIKKRNPQPFFQDLLEILTSLEQ
jgi:triacylglycerol lipase